jgi:SAM-dependent methyltransferase
MTMAVQHLDVEKAQQFGGQMVGILNNAATALMISVGHRTGLFDSMASMPPSTSADIAREKGLNERYVREWLGGMTVARIVEHDPVQGTYWLPPEHAMSLTRAAGPGNLATISQFMALMGRVEDGVVRAFENGGGVPYEEFTQFQRLMSESSAQVFDATLVDVTLALAPGLVERLHAGIDVLDVGTGAGHAVNVIARAFPKSRVTGIDFSREGVTLAEAEAAAWGLDNARFEVQDAATLDRSRQYDLITAFDAIHDQKLPARVLRGIYDALKPGGTFLCVDIAADSTHAGNMDNALGPYLYSISTFHCMTVSLALGGEGLGTVWGKQKALQMLSDAGFREVRVEQVEGDVLNNYYIARKR